MSENSLTYTGNPCVRCGEAQRYKSNKRCVRCQIEITANYKNNQRSLRPRRFDDETERMRGVRYDANPRD